MNKKIAIINYELFNVENEESDSSIFLHNECPVYYVSILKREENRVPGEKLLRHRRDKLWETMVRGIFPLSRYFPIISPTDELNYDSASPRETSTVGSTKHTVNLGLSQ